MKHLLLTTIAAVLVVGCVESQPPEPPDISILDAVRKGNIEAVKQHLAAGADVNAKGLGGLTDLHYAASGGQKEITELLFAEGADVNAKDESGKTPLHWAAWRGHKEVAELLIANDADVNARKNNGITPLDLAVDKETTDLLRKHGAK